jgi:hypothetical protein
MAYQPKQEERKVIDLSKIKETVKETPEGATLADICHFNENCKNENCNKYHPKWAECLCIKFVNGTCPGKNCP